MLIISANKVLSIASFQQDKPYMVYEIIRITGLNELIDDQQKSLSNITISIGIRQIRKIINRMPIGTLGLVQLSFIHNLI